MSTPNVQLAIRPGVNHLVLLKVDATLVTVVLGWLNNCKQGVLKSKTRLLEELPQALKEQLSHENPMKGFQRICWHS